jgi:hypothetical protein
MVPSWATVNLALKVTFVTAECFFPMEVDILGRKGQQPSDLPLILHL